MAKTKVTRKSTKGKAVAKKTAVQDQYTVIMTFAFFLLSLIFLTLAVVKYY